MTEVSVLEAKWMQDGAGDWLCLRVPTALSAMAFGQAPCGLHLSRPGQPAKATSLRPSS